jgi:hypothetical protein
LKSLRLYNKGWLLTGITSWHMQNSLLTAHTIFITVATVLVVASLLYMKDGLLSS